MSTIRTCQCQGSKYEDHFVPDEDTPMDLASSPELIGRVSSSGDSLYPGLIQLIHEAQAQTFVAQARIEEADFRAERAYFKVHVCLAALADISKTLRLSLPPIPKTSLLPGPPLRRWLTNHHRPPC